MAVFGEKLSCKAVKMVVKGRILNIDGVRRRKIEVDGRNLPSAQNNINTYIPQV